MNSYTYLKDKDFSQGRKYIGASDIPCLALLTKKYGQTPLTLWEEKTGRRESFEGNQRTWAGKQLEPVILAWGLDKLKHEPPWESTEDIIKMLMNNKFPDLKRFTESIHPGHSYLCAHADLIETDQPFIMEAKSTGFFSGIRREGSDFGYDLQDDSPKGIPAAVYLQIQAQMLCYDIPAAYVSVMIDTGLHHLFGPYKAHKKTQENILALAERFWWHVEHDQPPKPETWEDVQSINPVIDVENKTVVGGTELDAILEMKSRAESLRKRKKEIDAELDDLKNAVGLVLDKNKYLESALGDKLATCWDVERENVSLKEIRENHKRTYSALVKKGLISISSYRQIKF
jgi:hypothetical protein